MTEEEKNADRELQPEYKPTRRDYFAAAALTGLLANPAVFLFLRENSRRITEQDDAISSAIFFADDIIKRLDEAEKP